jgi:hypothetical protein
MLRRWWRRRQEERARQEQKDAATIVDARREVEHDRRDSDLSEADKVPPIFQSTDWTGGGPL